jgi:hypothetical protein
MDGLPSSLYCTHDIGLLSHDSGVVERLVSIGRDILGGDTLGPARRSGVGHSWSGRIGDNTSGTFRNSSSRSRDVLLNVVVEVFIDRD